MCNNLKFFNESKAIAGENIKMKYLSGEDIKPNDTIYYAFLRFQETEVKNVYSFRLVALKLEELDDYELESFEQKSKIPSIKLKKK